MMNKNLTEMSNEVLIKNEKKMKAMIFTYAGILIVAFVVIISTIIKKGFTPLIVTPIALLPILVIFAKNWNEMKKELKSRNL